MELYVLINRKKTLGVYIIDSIAMVLAVLALGAACVFPYAIIFTVVFGLIFYSTHFLTNVEYEYSYFAGEVNIAKITNKSRRKKQLSFVMEEVTMMAPQGHEAVVRMENDKTYEVKDFTSHDKEVPFWEAFVNKDGNKYLVMFEPDEPFINEIRTRYGSKVARISQ